IKLNFNSFIHSFFFSSFKMSSSHNRLPYYRQYFKKHVQLTLLNLRLIITPKLIQPIVITLLLLLVYFTFLKKNTRDQLNTDKSFRIHKGLFVYIYTIFFFIK